MREGNQIAPATVDCGRRGHVLAATCGGRSLSHAWRSRLSWPSSSWMCSFPVTPSPRRTSCSWSSRPSPSRRARRSSSARPWAWPSTLTVMAIQGRMDGENLLLFGFGALAGAGYARVVYPSPTASRRCYIGTGGRAWRGDPSSCVLVDALLPLDDPLEVEETTVRLMMEQLAAARVAFFEVDEAGRLVERRSCRAAGEDSPGPAGPLGTFAAGSRRGGRDGRALVLPVGGPRRPGGAEEGSRAGRDRPGLLARRPPIQ